MKLFTKYLSVAMFTLVTLLGSAALVGCNTSEGVGEDIEDVGDEIEDATD